MNQHKKYRELPEIPSGKASGTITPGCAVIEGGALRGVNSQGVLDALMENDINMQTVVGVSAGALAGMCYVAGDIGRGIRINLNYRKDPRYVGVVPLVTDSGIFGIDFILNETPKEYTFDYERFFSPERRFAAVATDCETGEPVVFERGKCSNIFQAVRASASMPFMSKPVTIDGKPYLDGGCSRSNPWEWALNEGFEKILLIRNRPLGFRCPDKLNHMAHFYDKKFPNLASVLERDNLEYSRESKDGEQAAKDGKVFLLCPGTNETVGRLEKDTERLKLFYWLGYYETLEKIDDIKKYLEV